MEFNPDTLKREHDFGGIETATQELKELGFSLDDSLFPKTLYQVIPNEIDDDYPRTINTRKPRAVAVVYPNGTLIFARPFDNNSILMEYQKILEEKLT